MYKLRTVSLMTHEKNGYDFEIRDVSNHTTSDDKALCEAMFCHAAHRAFSNGGSLATTALLVSTQFTTKGVWKKRTKAQSKANAEAFALDTAECNRRREAYWATRGVKA